MIKDLTACFDGLADPRVTRQCDHRLIDILVIAVSAMIACAESWEEIELYGRSKQTLDLLRKSGEFPMSYEELDDTAATVYEGISGGSGPPGAHQRANAARDRR